MKFDAARKTGEVFLFSQIGNPYEGVTDKAFADAMQRIGSVDELIVYINSPGGDVTTGMTIYNLLRAHRARKTVRVVGVAASIASIIAMAGDTIEIAKNGFFFVHNARSRYSGSMTSAMHRRTAEELDKMSDKMAETYADRGKRKKSEIQKLMDDESLLTAEESIKAGLADKLIDAAPADALMACAQALNEEHEGFVEAIKASLAAGDATDDKKSDAERESRQEERQVQVDQPEFVDLSEDQIKARRDAFALSVFIAERSLREERERIAR